jgi:hypothetical protein
MKFMRIALAAQSAGAALVVSGLAPVPVTSASTMGANRGPAKRLLLPSAGVEDARLIWQRPRLAPAVAWLVTGDWQVETGLASRAARTAAGAERRPGHSPAIGGADVGSELPDA